MKHEKAFTMVELMVVMVIILILAAIVYPSYAAYVIKARRIEGQIALLDTMQRQERHYSLHNSYIPFSATSTDPDERRFKWFSGFSARESSYELSGRACPGMTLQACIELRATPGTERVDPNFRDPGCGTLTLSSTGQQGAGGKQARCWP